jgi:multidrug resistance efflux pump
MSVTFGRQSGAAAIPQRTGGKTFEIPWSRVVKMGGAVAVLAIGAYAVMAEQVAIATDNAVVSAYSVSLRTPIDGIVEGAPLRIGAPVKAGDRLAEVSNNLIDDQRLIDLRERLSSARARLAGIVAQEGALRAIRDDLEQRSQAYIEASAARMSGSIAEAEHTLEAINERRDQAESNLKRRTSLARTGAASAVDLEKARADFNIATHEAAAQTGRLLSLRAQLDAMQKGVVSEPGSNDVAYSRQRADEISIRLSDLEQAQASANADVAETNARLQSEQARIDKLSFAPMVAPNAGIVWKVAASIGERVRAGDTIAQVVDCAASFIIATVPQNRVPEIQIGGEAEFRLSGDDVRQHGTVRSVMGDATNGDRNLAAVPFEQKDATATVRIDIPPGEGECLVGRTVRLLLPSSGHDLLARVFERFR